MNNPKNVFNLPLKLGAFGDVGLYVSDANNNMVPTAKLVEGIDAINEFDSALQLLRRAELICDWGPSKACENIADDIHEFLTRLDLNNEGQAG